MQEPSGGGVWGVCGVVGALLKRLEILARTRLGSVN